MSKTEYLVLWRDGDETWTSLETASKIIDNIDMSDCHNCDIEVYKVSFGKDPVRLDIHGCWHDPSDPLHIKLTDPDGNVEFDGYGTDH